MVIICFNITVILSYLIINYEKSNIFTILTVKFSYLVILTVIFSFLRTIYYVLADLNINFIIN